MSVICVANQKGGVGKTTTAAALAEGLSERGKRILLIDWDPQACLTITMGLNPDNIKRTGYDVLAAIINGRKGLSLEDVISSTSDPNIALVPASIELAQAQLDLVDAANRESVLSEMLRDMRRSYEYILIDCLPSLGLLTVNALTAADEVLIPLQADFLAMKGLVRLLATIIQVKEKLNPPLNIAGILFTMSSSRTLHSKEVIGVTRRAFGDRIRIFDAIIPTSVRFKEAPAAGKSILTYAPKSEGASAYRLLTEEVIRNEKG